MIKAIFFDLDDTLLWDHRSVKEAFVETCELAHEKFGVDPELLEESVRGQARTLYANYETYPFTKMIGISPFEGLWGNFVDDYDDNFQKMKENAPIYRKEAWTKGLKMLGIDDPKFAEKLAEYFPLARLNKPFVYEETFQVLTYLKENYQLLLLTNGSPDLQNTKLNLSPELIPYFDQIVISGAFGKGKPHPSIFQHALSLLSLKKEEAIMVGDNLMSDILGAKRAGIKSTWVNRQNKERNTEVTPDFEIKHLEELYPILEKLKKEIVDL